MMYPTPPPTPTSWSPYLPVPVTSEEGPADVKPRGLWQGRYSRLAGIFFTGLTLLAILAAILGLILGAQLTSTTAPSGWSRAYSGNLQYTSQWSGDAGCYTGQNGLDVTAGSTFDICSFDPSTTHDLVSSGFQIDLSLAPESTLRYALTPLIQVGDSSGSGVSVIFDDTGDYAICQDTSGDCSGCLPDNAGSLGCSSNVLANDSTVSWHTDPYVGNKVVVRYQVNSDSGGTLTIFANGQEVNSSTLTGALGTDLSIAIGAGNGGEARYTGATIYTGST
jgi:hypothetical protein